MPYRVWFIYHTMDEVSGPNNLISKVADNLCLRLSIILCELVKKAIFSTKIAMMMDCLPYSATKTLGSELNGLKPHLMRFPWARIPKCDRLVLIHTWILVICKPAPDFIELRYNLWLLYEHLTVDVAVQLFVAYVYSFDYDVLGSGNGEENL